MAPTHPGIILREEFLDPMGITDYQLAKAIGVPQTRISAIVHGHRRITADTGLRLSRYLGMSEAFWTGLPPPGRMGGERRCSTCATVVGMSETPSIPVRDLRNRVSEVLRRVEAGETLEVTVNNRPVALLVPKQDRPRTMSTAQFLAVLRQADPGLAQELAGELPETTDDLDDPWQR